MNSRSLFTVFHPILFAAYPILFLYSHNADITTTRLVFAPLLLATGAAILVWSVANLVLRNRLKSALVTTALLVLFFSYGHVYSAFERWLVERGAGGDTPDSSLNHLHLYLSSSYALLAIGAVSLLSRTRRDLVAATRAANVVSLMLVVLPLWSLATSPRAPGTRNVGRDVVDSATTTVLGYLPDIYYIILDGYARADTLENHYGFDNGPFTASLERKGFWIAPESASNYYWTFLSLASSLNMQHVTYLREVMGERSADRRLAYQAIKNNEVAAFLRSKGYAILHVASTWGATLENPFADETIVCGAGLFQVEFYRVLAETTWLRAHSSDQSTDLAECHLSNFARLSEIATRPGPKFVFAHFIPPHHPYLFDRHGNVLRNATVTNQFEMQERLWERKAQYVDQLIFVNRKIDEVVDAVLSRSERPPIIIVQSDHGPHVPGAGRRTHRLRLANLAAFYLPDHARFIPDTVTPVNEFRLIFNHYFAANLPLLEDRHYHSTYRRPYAFTEIDLGNRAAR